MTYLLRSVDEQLWRRVTAQAKAQGLTVRTVLILLLDAYASGRVVVEAREG
jgi:hypothetical protein